MFQREDVRQGRAFFVIFRIQLSEAERLSFPDILSHFKKLRRNFFESTNRNRVQYHLLPEFKRYVKQFFQCSLLLFVGICLVIISEWHLSSKLLWFC